MDLKFVFFHIAILVNLTLILCCQKKKWRLVQVKYYEKKNYFFFNKHFNNIFFSELNIFEIYMKFTNSNL